MESKIGWVQTRVQKKMTVLQTSYLSGFANGSNLRVPSRARIKKDISYRDVLFLCDGWDIRRVGNTYRVSSILRDLPIFDGPLLKIEAAGSRSQHPFGCFGQFGGIHIEVIKKLNPK